MIKILKNDLKATVATEEEKYQVLQPNHPSLISVEVLPDLLPVYAKVHCSLLKSPC